MLLREKPSGLRSYCTTCAVKCTERINAVGLAMFALLALVALAVLVKTLLRGRLWPPVVVKNRASTGAR